MDTECIHGMPVLDEDRSCCTICLGKLPGPAKKRPITWEFDPTSAPVDPAMKLIDDFSDGLICGSCMTPFDPIGCECSRKQVLYTDALYGDDDGNGGALAFLDELVEAGALREAEAGHIALSARRRAGRRAGLTPDEHQADRLDVAERYGMAGDKIRWRPFRVNEPTHLPV